MASLRESGTLGIYQRYKLGQAQFQKWLKQTWDRLRPDAPPTELAHPQNSTHTRGSNQAGKESQLKGNPKTASAVHWSQLESMAQTIIDHSKPEQIPPSAISILRDVVYLRKDMAGHFAKAAARSDSEVLRQKNSTHEHIIQVLERVLERFDAFLSKDHRSSPEPEHNEDGRLDMNVLNNMFEHLHVEQPHEEETEDEEEISDREKTPPKRAKKVRKKGGMRKKPNKQPNKQPEKQPKGQRVQERTTDSQDGSWVDGFKWVEEDDDDKEFDHYMRVYCYFQDVNSIRTYITDRWTEYVCHAPKSSPVFVDTLAVLTNAACEMFHEMERELVKALEGTSDLSSHGGENKGVANYLSMLETLHFKHRHGLGHLDGSGEDQLTDSEEYKITDEADQLGFFAHLTIARILGSVPPGEVPVIPYSAMKRPKYGVHDCKGFRDFTRDCVEDVFRDIYIAKAMKENGDLAMHDRAQDEWTFDLEDAFRKRDYSSATIFGLSLYIDIRYILETRVTEAFDLVQATAAKTKTILQDNLPEFIEELDKAHCLYRIGEANVFILRDFLENDKVRMLKEHGYKVEFERHQLLKRDPIWSGLLDLRCRLGLNDLGLRFINQSPIALGAVFAYAMFLTGETQGWYWPRMERFLDVYDWDRDVRGHLFTPVDLLRRFFILFGTELPFVGRFSTPTRVQALYERYASDSQNERSGHSMAYLGEIIRDNFDLKAAGVFSSQAAMPRTTAGQTSQPTRRRVSPVELLKVLDYKTGSISMTELSIDLFRLHTECLQLFQKLNGEFFLELQSGFDEYQRKYNIVLVLIFMWTRMQNGDAAGIRERFGKAVGEFCLEKLREHQQGK